MSNNIISKVVLALADRGVGMGGTGIRMQKKLKLEEWLENENWSPIQWTLAVIALIGITYGLARFIEWAVTLEK